MSKIKLTAWEIAAIELSVEKNMDMNPNSKAVLLMALANAKDVVITPFATQVKCI